jgi:DNA-binding MarR family transcriptional regulator
MRNEYNKLIDLIQQWGIFEKETEIKDLETFAVWILKNKNGVDKKSNGKNGNGGNGHHANHFIETNINWKLLRLARFSELYMKIFFKEEKINFNEFRVLAVLHEHKILKKNEVINENLFETTTGTTIIKNLVEKNYLEEVEDRSDKRIKRVQLSPRGKVLFEDVNRRYNDINLLVTANLSDDEKGSLSAVLEYLDSFHQKMHQQLKNDSLGELIEQYIVPK